MAGALKSLINCDHDCASCSIQYPKGFKVDESDDLYGFIKGWSTHVLVATGKTDWVRDVADEKGSVMQAIGAAKGPTNGVRLLCGGRRLYPSLPFAFFIPPLP
jgi:hypothetical protein